MRASSENAEDWLVYDAMSVQRLLGPSKPLDGSDAGMDMCGVTGDTLEELDEDDVEPALDGRRVRSELNRVIELYLEIRVRWAPMQDRERRTCSSPQGQFVRQSMS